MEAVERELGSARRPCVALAHPKPQMLRSLKTLLEPEFDVIAMADNPVSLLDAIEAHRTPLVVLEISLRSEIEVSLVRHVADRHPETQIVLIGDGGEAAAAEVLLRSGCFAFVPTQRISEELALALHAALDTETRSS